MTATRVLIVDDAEQVRRDLSAVLNLIGELEIVGEAINGLEAIHLTESLKPDVVLMDLEMPIMNGYESARQIKSRYPACRVIALTVHDYPSARAEAQASGVDAFLVKGVRVEKIVQTVLKKE
jgi:two-component system NarL family response regulator